MSHPINHKQPHNGRHIGQQNNQPKTPEAKGKHFNFDDFLPVTGKFGQKRLQSGDADWLDYLGYRQ